MTTKSIAVEDDFVESHVTSKRRRRSSRSWHCRVSVCVAHSCPLLAMGVVATLRQEPGYDVTLADDPSSAQNKIMGGVHVLITDRFGEIPETDCKSTGVQSSRSPRPRVILLTNGTPAVGCRFANPESVDTCLSVDCTAEELLAAVRQLGHTALGPLATSLQTSSIELPTRGGLAPSALREVCSYIENHLASGVDLDSLARIAGLSCCHFSRSFKRSTGMPAHHYLITRRISAALALISDTNLPLCEISLEVGFADQSHFTRTFVQLVGMTPGDFRHRSR